MNDRPAPPRQQPRGGIGHPTFDALRPGEHLLVVLGFEGTRTEAELDKLESALQAWSRAAGRLDTSDAVHAEEPFLSRTALRLRLHNLQHPRAAVERLLGRFAEAGLPFRESFFARLCPIPGRDEFVAAPDPAAPQPLTEFATPESYAAALFAPSGPPPASEYPHLLKGAYRLPSSEMVFEERGTPLFAAGLRLGYGVLRGTFAAPDARASEVAEALRLALAEALPGQAPGFFEHSGKPGQVDRVEAFGHTGYGFAIRSSDLVWRYAQSHYRYREAEVVEALAAVGAKLGLSVGCWQRYGEPIVDELRSVHTHVFQLWG